jgi:hypothetical protein
MQKYTDVVTSARSGAAKPDARVTVKTYPAGVVATIYSDDGVTTQDNPITTDSNGEFSFYAADGLYTITVSGTGITERTIGPILFHDPADDDDYAQAADVSFTPSGSGLTTTVGAFLQNPTFYSSAKADGESFYAESGETVFVESADQTEASQTGTGTDFDPSTTYVCIKFTTSSTASFIQGISLRVKKTGSLTDSSSLSFALYTDSGGAPNTLLSSGGQIFGGQVTSSYAELYAMLQNVTTELSASTTYWVVITRSESGGDFVLDSTAGTGSTYTGAALGSLSDSNSIIYYKIYARSEYPIHTTGKHTHSVWGVSVTGVGVRGDSTSHYGVYGQSVSDPGVRGTSTYQEGVLGTSTHGSGVVGSSSSTTSTSYAVYGNQTGASGGAPGVYGSSTSGPGVLANTSMSGVGSRQYAVRSFQGMMFGASNIFLSSATAIPTSGTWTEGDILAFKGNSARGGLAFVKCTTTGTPGNWAPVNLDGVGADVGDADVTLTVNASATTQIYATELTANRTVTLSTTGAYNGARFRIVRSGLGAFTLDVGGLKTIASATAAWCDVEYSGSAWVLTAYGTL